MTTALVVEDGRVLWDGQTVGEEGTISVASGEELGGVLVLKHRYVPLAPIPGGDVLMLTASGVVGVERKRLDNLVSSWYSGELSQQLGIMLSYYDHVVLLCEGELLHHELRYFQDPDVTYHRLQQDLVTWQELGVRVVHSVSLKESGRLVGELFDYYNRTAHHALDKQGAQDVSVYRRMLLAVPGWGSETVTSTLKAVGPPILVFNGEPEKLLSVKNVTPRRLKLLFEALGRKVHA